MRALAEVFQTSVRGWQYTISAIFDASRPTYPYFRSLPCRPLLLDRAAYRVYRHGLRGVKHALASVPSTTTVHLHHLSIASARISHPLISSKSLIRPGTAIIAQRSEKERESDLCSGLYSNHLNLVTHTMKSFTAISLATLVAATFASASSTKARCFREPFPQLLQTQIDNERRCGPNNPFVLNVVCVPVRGLVPDAVWRQFQLDQFEQEEQEEAAPSLPAPSASENALPFVPAFEEEEEEESSAEFAALLTQEGDEDIAATLARLGIFETQPLFPVRASSAPASFPSPSAQRKRDIYSTTLGLSRGMAVSAFAAAAAQAGKA